MDKIAVLIPCYNEEKTIAKVIKDTRAALPEAVIYVYDNNSTDRTGEIAKAEGAVVRHEYMQGKGNVIRRMFREIEARCYIMVDGDDTEYYDAYNPYMELTLDTSTMTIGKVYTIHIRAIRNRHDTETYNEPFYETKSNTHGTITTTTTTTTTKESSMMFGSTSGGTSSIVTGWFSVKPEIDDMPIATNTTGTVTLCKASVYYNNAATPSGLGIPALL